MYHYQKYYQGSFIDFNQSCGMELDTQNEWVILGDRIEWSKMEDDYAKNFPAPKGRVPLPLRTALGAIIIQSRKGLTDRSLVKEISENPYFQYFIGMHFFSPKCP